MSETPLRYSPTFADNPDAKLLYIAPGHARLFERVDEEGKGRLLIAYSKRKATRIGFNRPQTEEEAHEEVLPLLELVINNTASIDVYIKAMQKLKDMMLAKQKEEPDEGQANPG